MKHKWRITKLGDVLTERRETPTHDDLTSGRVRIIEKISFDSGRIQLRVDGSTKTGMILVHPGDLVVSGINAAKGAIAIYDADEVAPVAATIHYGAYETNPQQADVRFLWWMLRSRFFQDLLLEYVPGGIKTELKAKRLLPVPVPLPPLSEQRRVIAIIEAFAAQLSEARTFRREAAKESELLAHARARASLSKLTQPITQLSEWLHPSREGIQTGPFGAQLSSSEFTEAGVPLLTIGNIQYSGLDSSTLKFVSPTKADQLSRYRVHEGDILFARMGTVGRCCIVPKQADGWLINYHIIRVALDTKRVEPRFVHWTIQSSSDVESFLDDKIRGATREGVNSKIVAALPCRIPPLPEQRRIVAELDELQTEVDTLKRLQAETDDELDALLPSILDKAFKGEL